MMAAGDTVGAVVEAARAVVARHRGPGDLPEILDGLDRLAAALEAHDAVDGAPRPKSTCPHSWYDDECKCGLPPRTGVAP